MPSFLFGFWIPNVLTNFDYFGQEFNAEGRSITAEFDNFFLVTSYVPNAGAKLVTLPKRMKWDPLFR